MPFIGDIPPSVPGEPALETGHQVHEFPGISENTGSSSVLPVETSSPAIGGLQIFNAALAGDQPLRQLVLME